MKNEKYYKQFAAWLTRRGYTLGHVHNTDDTLERWEYWRSKEGKKLWFDATRVIPIVNEDCFKEVYAENEETMLLRQVHSINMTYENYIYPAFVPWNQLKNNHFNYYVMRWPLFVKLLNREIFEVVEV